MCLGGTPDNGAAEARAREEQRQARIATGMGRITDTFNQFDDKFYDTRRAQYLDYAMPQYEDQYTKAKKALVYALDSKRLLNSSEGASKFKDFETEAERQRRAIQDQGLQLSNQARGDVERGRSDLVNQLNATADPTAAANAALARAGVLGAQPTFSPLVGLFQNVSASLADRRLTQDRSDNRPHYGSSAFPGSSTSSTVVK